MCPLKKVHTIISDENIWVNIQNTDYPVLMSFDLDNKKYWQPFFDGKRTMNALGLGATSEERTV